MARTKQAPVAEVVQPQLNGEALTATQNLMAAIQSSHSNDRDLVNQLLGQAQMADAIGKFTATVAVSKMA